MTEFRNDDMGYFAWITENPNGFVMNVRRVANPDYVVLHRATCHSISNDCQASGAFTTRGYRKICATDLAELKLAARREGRRDGSFSKSCGLCRPKIS